MNYIKHLAGFFERVAVDERLNPTHVSMYVSLFQFWNASRFQNPISISRNELMKVSKISAKATYHKCMRELNNFGYLQYKPSYNPFKGSLVYLFNFQSGTEQASIGDRTKIETGIEQAQEPYINISKHNKLNSSNILTQAKKNNVQKMNRSGKKEKEKLRQKKKKTNSPLGVGGVPPQLKQVQEYFASKKYSPTEAEKFYKHYKSNGWLIGGKTKMVDWQASADKWMLNDKNFFKSKSVKPTAKHLHATQNKNYSEPL